MANTEDLSLSSALHEILHWSGTCPDWQRDALRRIVLGKLDQGDIEELERLCRAKHDALKQGENLPLFQPLEEKHIPDGIGNELDISLISLSNLQNVNRLPSNQILAFGESPGVTIIFGDNGTGKSSYARVIKKACRARGQVKPIEPNAYEETSSGVATAEFIIDEKGVQSTIAWQNNGNNDPRLGQIFTFDSDSAEHYIHENGGTSFTPFGLDILVKLAQDACTPIANNLRKQVEEMNTAITVIKKDLQYKPQTSVGKLLSIFSASTTEEHINTLAIWDNSDATKLIELNALLASDPKVKSNHTYAAAKRIREFRTSSIKLRRMINVPRVKKLQALLKDTQQARAVANDLAKGKFDISFLPCTGSELWKKLWNAAREYSQALAYPNNTFPFTDDNSVCVLCQSTLDNAAKERLRNFDEFISNKASQVAEQKEAEANIYKIKFINTTNLLSERKKIEADIGSLNLEAQNVIDDFITSATNRLNAIIESIKTNDWSTVPDFTSSPNIVLKTLEINLIKQAQIEAASVNPEERERLRQEKEELEDRQWLSRSKSQILNLLTLYKNLAKLQKCIKDTNTALISNKNKALRDKYITNAFCRQFDQEILELGLKTISVELKPVEGSRGIAMFGVKLQNCNHIEVGKIASEGEKRCIALALFFAELKQASHLSSLVFDDPVSSFGHHYKEKTADRLVKEGLKRQVIVFTHDPVFLHELMVSIEKHQVKNHNLYLEWRHGSPGYCTNGLPWDNKKVKERLHELEQQGIAIKKTWNPIPNEENKRAMEIIYSRLRSTLERIVEEIILAGTISRFDRAIKVAYLKEVVGFSQNEFDELFRLYEKCHSITEAHDHAQARHGNIPSPDEFLSDINAVKQLKDSIISRKNRLKVIKNHSAIS